MTLLRSRRRLFLVTALLTICCVATYCFYLLASVLAVVLLAVLALIPLSLLIPVTVIRYGVYGAYIGTMAGYFPLFCIAFISWGSFTVNPEWLLLLICYGGGAVVGSSIGVFIALRGNR